MAIGFKRNKQQQLYLEMAAKSIRLAVFDFDGVFTSNMVYVNEHGVESVRCCRSDGIGINALERAGVSTLILSTETNPVVKVRAEKLKMRAVHGCADKLRSLTEIVRDAGISMENVAFLGNDTNDAACLARVGLPAIVADAHEDVARLARYQTSKRGGEGAVRELCDALLRARGFQ